MADAPVSAFRPGDHPAAPSGDRVLRPPTFVIPIAVAVGAAAIAVVPQGAEAFIAGAAAAVLVMLAAIDIEHGMIPNRIVLPAFGVVLVAQLAFYPGHAVEWIVAPLGAALVLLIPHLVRSAWMGMGDVKLMLLIGAAVGWQVAGAVLLAFACVFPVALVIVATRGLQARKATIPFGPFLAAGALIVIFTQHL